MRNILIVILLVLTAYVHSFADGDKGFVYYDTLTYRLYEEARWKELAATGKEALKAGYDYYYLRMRVGIALYEMGRFLPAIEHFGKASEMNPLSNDPLLYLYYCYVETGRWLRAREVLAHLPASEKDSILQLHANSVYAEGGYLHSGAKENAPMDDLGGRPGQYGEAFVPLYYQHYTVGYEYKGSHRVSLHMAATWFTGKWQHRAMRAEQVLLDESMNNEQREGYLSLNLNLGKGFYLLPAYHFIHLDYNYTSMEYDPWTGRYSFSPVTQYWNDHVASLSLEKTAGRLAFSLSGAYSSLFREQQYQGAIGITWFPLGNLDLYTGTRVINHYNNEDPGWVISQEVGFKIHENLWMELQGSAGKMENYHENNAYTVYNTGYPLEFIGEAALFLMISENIFLIFDYRASKGEGSWVQYRLGPGPLPPVAVSETFSFWDHHFSGGLKWNF